MALIEFNDLPNTSTPVTADNLNNNFNELNNINNCKIVTFNNEWRTATLPVGDYLKISIPILNPNIATPTINITSAQIYNGANWVNLPLPQMDSKTTNEIILGFNYGVADGLTAGNCYLIRMTGTMSVN